MGGQPSHAARVAAEAVCPQGHLSELLGRLRGWPYYCWRSIGMFRCPICEILRAYLTKLASFLNRTQEETALRECAEEIGRLQAARSCMLAVCQSWPKTTLLKSLGGKFVGTVCALAIPTIRA